MSTQIGQLNFQTKMKQLGIYDEKNVIVCLPINNNFRYQIVVLIITFNVLFRLLILRGYCFMFFPFFCV